MPLDSIPLYVIAFLACAAFLAGFIDSIAGGGGLISLPATLVAGVPPHLALGTGKLMAFSGTIFSLAFFARSKAVNWRIVMYGIVFSLVGSILGARLALEIEPNKLAKIITFLLFFAAIVTLAPKKKQACVTELSTGSFFARTAVVCFLVGGYDGFFGPATGTILLLALHFFLRLSLVSASGTAKAFNLASNGGALVTFLRNDQVLFSVGIPMAIANILGNILGAKLVVKGGEGVVRRMLFLSLTLLFIFLVHRYFW